MTYIVVLSCRNCQAWQVIEKDDNALIKWSCAQCWPGVGERGQPLERFLTPVAVGWKP